MEIKKAVYLAIPLIHHMKKKSYIYISVDQELPLHSFSRCLDCSLCRLQGLLYVKCMDPDQTVKAQ